jgi:hypothetical protein
MNKINYLIYLVKKILNNDKYRINYHNKCIKIATPKNMHLYIKVIHNEHYITKIS